MENYDFSGWATKNDIRCSDGLIIREDAFKHCDGLTVPLVWNHDHSDPYRIVGHALLENRNEGVYAYGKFNNTDLGETAKIYVQHGDINQLSIYANQLQKQGPNVVHGTIREVSLVLAGANPGAYIESVIKHGEECDEEAVIYTGEEITLSHSETEEHTEEPVEEDEFLSHADDEKKKEEDSKKEESPKKDESEKADEGKNIADVFATLNAEQKEAVYAIVGQAIKDAKEDGKEEPKNEESKKEDSKGGDEEMKHNVFDKEETKQGGVLSHSDQEAIIEMAKQSSVGSLQTAMKIYAEENKDALQHADEGPDIYEQLFPEYELLKKGEPETLERDQSWIAGVMRKIHKSPISRIRTRQADARIAELRAKGYQKKGDEKTITAKIKLLSRTTDPQTIYIKDQMHRDDIIDITDFDVVAYQWRMLRHVLDEELAMAALVGDGRDDGDPDKIHETHIRSIWHDEELYTIHTDVDIEAARAELQGTNTSANFGENYIYAEAIITAALYSREKYKGSGTPDLYCTPHLLNVMLLARDLNGRRIYDSKADLAAALNVGEIITVEQFEGLERTTTEGDKKKLLGLFVNLADYQFGSTKGGEITRFEDFDMDFNRYKYMLETRLSGSLTKVYSAIALEEPVTSGE